MPGEESMFDMGTDVGVQELNTSIEQLSDDDFDKLMSGEAPIADPKAPAKPASTAKPTPGAKAADTKAETETTVQDDTTIEEEQDTEFLDDKPKKGRPVGTTNKAKEEAAATEDEEGIEEGDDEEVLDDDSTIVALSNTYSHLVKTGIWKEVEKDENFDPENVTPEVYAQIAVQQATEQAQEAFEELMDRTGPYRRILDHALRHGDPEEIIDLFKDQQINNALDMSVPTDQKEIIRKYYTNIMDWEPADVETFINKAEMDKELDKYSSMAKKGYQKHIDNSLKAKDDERKQREYKIENDRRKYVETMSEAINTLPLQVDDKKRLHRALLQPTIKIDANKTLTAFQAKMLQIQQDPLEYLDLVQFAMDKAAYLERHKVVKEVAKNKTNFQLKIGGSGKKTGSVIPATRKIKEEEQELKFFT